jgi:hypothetical protein
MATSDRRPVVTRRTLQGGAAVATTAALVTVGEDPSAATAVPRVPVTPVWTEELRRTYGVGVLPATSAPAYGHVDAYLQRLADLGAAYVRGRYRPEAPDTARIVEQCRALGLKWLMSVIPENWAMSERRLKGVLVHIRDHAADVCLGIEGMNEPNHNRDGSPVRPDWPQLTVGYQRVIRTFLDQTPSMAGAVSVGPSLQMGAKDPTPDFFALRDAGLPEFLDHAGLHSYPSGWGPAMFVDQRLGWVRDAWGDVPVWVTETGYHTARKAPFVVGGGAKPVPQDVAATYGPRSVLEFARRGAHAARFELLDKPNKANDVPMDNYGIIENTGDDPSTWNPKKEYASMQSFLTSLRDPVASYRPPTFRVGVSGPRNLEWLPVGKSDSSRSLLMYRAASVWDPDTRTRRSTKAARVTVTDRLGTRVVKVGPDVVSVPIR